MTTSDGWDWSLTETARRDFEGLDPVDRERVAAKLDDVVSDPWRDVHAYLDPLAGVPHQKLRVGQFRLGCRLDRETMTLWVLRVKRRGGDAYRDDD